MHTGSPSDKLWRHAFGHRLPMARRSPSPRGEPSWAYAHRDWRIPAWGKPLQAYAWNTPGGGYRRRYIKVWYTSILIYLHRCRPRVQWNQIHIPGYVRHLEQITSFVCFLLEDLKRVCVILNIHIPFWLISVGDVWPISHEPEFALSVSHVGGWGWRRSRRWWRRR